MVGEYNSYTTDYSSYGKTSVVSSGRCNSAGAGLLAVMMLVCLTIKRSDRA